jgi:hypothetical protein
MAEQINRHGRRRVASAIRRGDQELAERIVAGEVPEDRLTDILKGGRAIAGFVGEPYPVVWRWIQAKRIPAGRIGGLLIGSKRRIAEALDRLASGATS